MILIFLLAAATFAAPFLLAAADKKDSKGKTAESSKGLKGLPTEGLTEDEAILQALNRLGFGPRPGDVERVKEMGLQKWIDQQLHPDSIDDSALDARLQRFPTLKMSSAKLLDEFPEPQLAARREGITVEQYRKEQQEQMRSAMQSAMQSGRSERSHKRDTGQRPERHADGRCDAHAEFRGDGQRSERQSGERERAREGAGRLSATA